MVNDRESSGRAHILWWIGETGLQNSTMVMLWGHFLHKQPWHGVIMPRVVLLDLRQSCYEICIVVWPDYPAVLRLLGSWAGVFGGALDSPGRALSEPY